MTDLYKVVTYDYRPPIQGGAPLCDGTTWPVELPAVALDTSNGHCGAGWNAVEDPADALKLCGIMRDGKPVRLLRVRLGSDAIRRGVKVRSSHCTLLGEVEMRVGIEALSRPYGEHAPFMVEAQVAWYEALWRPRRDESVVIAGLEAALAARGLDWVPKRYDTARDAWAAWAAWAAWDARAARAAWDARDARAAMDARAARAAMDAWAARDAWDALTVQYAALMGWVGYSPDLLTAGLRDAYRHGLGIAVPTGPAELGWTMAASWR